MNQGRIWCVVNPTVGLPLFLASIAITSLIVHASVMTHTTWMGNYWQGKAPRTAMIDPAADQAKLAVLENLVAEQKLAMAQAAQSVAQAQAAHSVVVASAEKK